MNDLLLLSLEYLIGGIVFGFLLGQLVNWIDRRGRR